MSKRCVKCSKDVTNDKRMKDAKGQYWCFDCGAKDEASRGSGLVQKCPGCGTPTHAAKFIRVKERYVCENCAEGGGKGKVKGGASDTRNDKIKVIVGVVCLLFGVFLIVQSL